MKLGNCEIVGTLTTDIIDGDTVSFRKTYGYGKPIVSLTGIVTDCLAGNRYRVIASGCVFVVKHEDIYMIEFTGEDVECTEP